MRPSAATFFSNVARRTKSLPTPVLDNRPTLSWQTYIDKISNKLSRVRGMAFKPRHCVPLSTLRLIYYGMFNSILQYFLMNWGRTFKCHFYRIKVLQNRFFRLVYFVKATVQLMFYILLLTF